MPAGIELYGVGALGIGLVDGDRLVSVDGRSVERRGQVIGAVLAARADERPSMRAGLVRHTKDGPVAFTVEVAQPYPESSAQPSPGVDDAEGVELEPALPEVTKSAPQ